MPPIPAALSIYGPALLALVAALAVSAAGRAKTRQIWLRPGLSLACLLGWAALEPLTRLRMIAFAPSLAPSLLIVPAGVVALIEAVRAWRAGRNDRLLSVLAAGFVGWWLARAAAPPGEFWRVWIVVAALTGLVAYIVRQQPGRGLALALALWGSLAVIGLPTIWLAAAAIMAAAWLGPMLLRLPAAVPSALVVALLASADLSRSRLFRVHLGPADLACLLALAAPLLAAGLEPRLGKKWRVLAPVLAAVLIVALVWALRRTLP